MHIQLNGEPRELSEGTTLSGLIGQLGLTGKRLAVELNEDIIPRSQHNDQVLTDGDRVELVHAIGGG
ncbi:sulfur carrier protein ThiS [uncultured Marinobacter sp.]|uniref:sulfur carrier protein ThiS n=1 Tax=uncultured Marinobacter sp. TaxID=187379 RepID=UPI0030DC9CC5